MRDQLGNTHKNTKKVEPPLHIDVTSREGNKYRYSLCGIITHLGSSMDTGHYVAEIIHDSSWYKCDDSIVRKTSYNNLSKEGYGYLFEKT